MEEEVVSSELWKVELTFGRRPLGELRLEGRRTDGARTGG